MTDSNRVQKARELANELVYSVAKWRGRSPEFMQTIVNRWTEKLAAFADKEVAEERRWIAVDERLPEIGSRVLTWGDWGPRLVTYTENSEQHRTIIRRDGQWWDDGKHITHWRTIEPPTAAIRQRGSKSGGSDDE